MALVNSTSNRRIQRGGGFTLIELLMAVALVGILSAIALPSYHAMLQRQKVAHAIRDLSAIAMQIERYHSRYFALPPSLLDLGEGVMTDPWGFEYQYLNFDSTDKNVKGKIRKDHNLHPLNTSMDLYSVGPDGASVPPLTGKPSRDDVIWARDGSYIGPAADF
jgi:general secretion pathway protein G